MESKQSARLCYRGQLVWLLFDMLGPDVVRKGMRTFQINGVQNFVSASSCFVAMMYGNEDELWRDFTKFFVHDFIANSLRFVPMFVAEKLRIPDAELVEVLYLWHSSNAAEVQKVAVDWLRANS